MELEKVSKGTPRTGIKAYDSALKVMRCEIGEFTKDNVLAYLKGLEGKGYSPATINTRIKAVRKMLTLSALHEGEHPAITREKMDAIFNAEGLKLVKVDNSIGPEDVIDPEDLKRIIAASDERTGLIIEALYYSAARISELLGIRLDRCTVRGDAVHCEIIGKGRRARTIYLPAALFLRIKSTFRSRTWLFESKTHGQLDRSNTWKKVAEAGRAIGFGNLHPHAIRHSWATSNLERLGVHKVSRYLGHADISTTSKFYLHNNASAEEIITEL